ncbi:MAG: hypothetical protein JOY68_10370 [Candidatus Dormibacteraeota bacterium]|nr:hypothetical protein [Candidatus Dormibacteraeota bacterium]
MSLRGGRTGLCGIALCVAMLAACSAGPAGMQPRNGGTITVALPSMPMTLNPLVSRDPVSERAYTALFPLLFVAQPDLSASPQLAAGAPSFGDGGLTITVNLRQDAHWSDGSPITANDVVFTVTTEMDPKLDALTPFTWAPLSSVTAVDAHTVRFTLSTADAAFIADDLVTPIVPQHALAGVDPAHMADAAYSSEPSVTGGPFRFATRDATSITLDASSSFFLGRPHADRVVERVVSGSIPALLGEGQVSFDAQLSAADAAQGLISSGVGVQSFADPSFTAVQYNLRAGHAFAALATRQAFADSIDHDALVSQVTGDDNDIPVWSDLDPSSWAFDSTAAPAHPRNAAAAASLLGGAHPSASLIYPDGDQLLALAAAALVQQANAAGFALSAAATPPQEYAAALQQGNFDAALVTLPTGLDPDDSALLAPAGAENAGAYADPAVTALLSQELNATGPSLGALQQTRKPLFTKIERAVAGDLPLYFLWAPRHSVGFGATLGGVAGAGIQLDADRDNTFYVNWFLTG